MSPAEQKISIKFPSKFFSQMGKKHMQSDHTKKKNRKNNTFRSEEGISHITLLIKSAEIKRNWCKVREKNRHSYFFFYLKERGKYRRKNSKPEYMRSLTGNSLLAPGAPQRTSSVSKLGLLGENWKFIKLYLFLGNSVTKRSQFLLERVEEGRNSNILLYSSNNFDRDAQN